jgi:hypothetical protein
LSLPSKAIELDAEPQAEFQLGVRPEGRRKQYGHSAKIALKNWKTSRTAPKMQGVRDDGRAVHDHNELSQRIER